MRQRRLNLIVPTASSALLSSGKSAIFYLTLFSVAAYKDSVPDPSGAVDFQ